MKKGDLVRARDYLTRAERDSLPACKPYQANVMIEYTGEFRPPKSGEWFISGGPPDGYRAGNDLGTKYHIGRPVIVERKTTTTVVQRMPEVPDLSKAEEETVSLEYHDAIVTDAAEIIGRHARKIERLEKEISGLKKSLEVVSASENYWRAAAKWRSESLYTKRHGAEE